jgi:hypothetical protein
MQGLLVKYLKEHKMTSPYADYNKARRFEVLMVVKMLMLVFWVVIQCEVVGTYQCFGATYCLHHHG